MEYNVDSGIYQYEYNNSCYNICPDGTYSLDETKICEEKKIITEDKENCELIRNDLKLFLTKEISEKDINFLTEDYANKSTSFNHFVFIYESYYYIYTYKIYIYKNLTCLKMTINKAPQIEFRDCYEKVKKEYNITDDLIVTIIKVESGQKRKKSFISSNIFKYFFFFTSKNRKSVKCK